MHPKVEARLRDLFVRFPPPGPRFLDIGAKAKTVDALLPALGDVDYTVVNLERPRRMSPSVRLVEGNANDLTMFGAGSFDAVLSNDVCEHDPRFWLSLSEIRRVLRPGGRFYVGVPGFPTRVSRPARAARRVEARLRSSRAAPLRRAGSSAVLTRLVAARTYPFHAAPGDYYRFSQEAVRTVLLEGYDTVHVEHLLEPVRLIGVGDRRPGPPC